MKNLCTKAYVKYKSLLHNEKGSQALEWIGIAAVIVILTGLIATAFDGQSSLGNKFKTAFEGWIDEITGSE